MSLFLTNYTVPNLSEWMNQPRQQFGPIAAGRPQQMGGILGRGMPASAPTPAPQPFVWGANGQMTDPRQRAAQVDTSPIGHWTEGAARVANALVGSMQDRRDASRAAGFPDIPRTGFGFVNPFTAYTKGGGLY